MQYLCEKNYEKMNTIGLGNALVDVLLRLENDDVLSEIGIQKGAMDMINREQMIAIRTTLAGLPRTQTPGGSVCNTMRSMSSLGANSGFIGKIGDDSIGGFYEDALEKAGVSSYFIKTDGLTGSCTVMISPDGERTFGTYLGAASTLKAEDLSLSMFTGYSYLYIEGYLVQDHEMILHAMELGKQAGLQICLDLASYNIVAEDLEFITYLIETYVDIVFSNEEEARAFTGKEPEEALDVISQKCSIAVVKLGAKGAMIKKGSRVFHIDAVKVDKAIDTTGAGDYFAAGFLYGLTLGTPLEKCGMIGALLATHVIQVIGTTLSNEKWNEIKLNIDAILSE
jgi:sugar/nucleoside kinase (ribokinase family)